MNSSHPEGAPSGAEEPDSRENYAGAVLARVLLDNDKQNEQNPVMRDLIEEAARVARFCVSEDILSYEEVDDEARRICKHVLEALERLEDVHSPEVSQIKKGARHSVYEVRSGYAGALLTRILFSTYSSQASQPHKELILTMAEVAHYSTFIDESPKKDIQEKAKKVLGRIAEAMKQGVNFDESIYRDPNNDHTRARGHKKNEIIDGENTDSSLDGHTIYPGVEEDDLALQWNKRNLDEKTAERFIEMLKDISPERIAVILLEVGLVAKELEFYGRLNSYVSGERVDLARRELYIRALDQIRHGLQKEIWNMYHTWLQEPAKKIQGYGLRDFHHGFYGYAVFDAMSLLYKKEYMD